MMKLLIAMGIGFTAYAFKADLPTWFQVFNVTMDAVLVLNFLDRRRA